MRQEFLGSLVMLPITAALVGCTVLTGCTVHGSGFLADGAAPDTSLGMVFVQLGTVDDPANYFGDVSETASTPTIRYPLDGTLVPPNVGGLEVHFEPGDSTLFELAFEQAGARVITVYDQCHTLGLGCRSWLTGEAWSALVARRTLGPYVLRVRGADRDRVASASSRAIQLDVADEPVMGTLYFTSGDRNRGLQALFRYDFSSASPLGELYAAPPELGTFVYSATPSPDGTRVAVGYETGGPSPSIAILDATSRSPLYTLQVSIGEPMIDFSPDGTQIVFATRTMMAGPISVTSVDGSGAPVDVTPAATTPAWSPDGRSIIASSDTGPLARWDRAPDGSWTPRGEVSSSPHGYPDLQPSFAPDPTWIAFSRGGGQFVGPSTIWVVRVAGDGEQQLLRAFTASPARDPALAMDYQPAFHRRRFRQRGADMYWLVFASNMRVGVTPDPDAFGPRSVLWMAAIDPAITDGDPSRPAFAIPSLVPAGSAFEGTTDRPRWAAAPNQAPCAADSDCGANAICLRGQCAITLP